MLKLFCGVGKSMVQIMLCHYYMYKLHKKSKKTCVVVFPTLNLLNQFENDYVSKYLRGRGEEEGEDIYIRSICSETDGTTDISKIKNILSEDSHKLILITYQSFHLLSEAEIQVDLCIFDEAHHVVGEKNQTLVFNNDTRFKYRLYFTATPVNKNGVVMYDKFDKSRNQCGEMLYNYSYYNGLKDDILQDFNICLDFSTDTTNNNTYESIARAALKTGNHRILSFHSTVDDSEKSRNSSVKNFVNPEGFRKAFKHILEKEFPERKKEFEKSEITLKGIHSSTKDRVGLLKEFAESPDRDIYILSSCETIGEGIDTKNANMCVFVDPKSSHTKIIQNIGRIVRKVGTEIPSTVLIPCVVDKTKYENIPEDDLEAVDAQIREDLMKGGNFNCILNVLSAIKQEDEELYDLCLYYPSHYTPREVIDNLKEQGLSVERGKCGTKLSECLEHLLDIQLENRNLSWDDSEELLQLATDNKVNIELHTVDMKDPIKEYKSADENAKSVRIYEEYDHKAVLRSKKRFDNIVCEDDGEEEGGDIESLLESECESCSYNSSSTISVDMEECPANVTYYPIITSKNKIKSVNPPKPRKTCARLPEGCACHPSALSR